MSKATLARLRRLEVKPRMDGAIGNLTDERLFSALRDLTAVGGGVDALSKAPHAGGEERPAWDVVAVAPFRLLPSSSLWNTDGLGAYPRLSLPHVW